LGRWKIELNVSSVFTDSEATAAAHMPKPRNSTHSQSLGKSAAAIARKFKVSEISVNRKSSQKLPPRAGLNQNTEAYANTS
jgi:hypothetical protein